MTTATRTRRAERRGLVAVIAAIAAAFALGLVALFAAMTGYRP